MDQINVDSDQIEVVFAGARYKMRLPSTKEVKEVSRKMGGSDAQDADESIINLLVKLGLPQQVAEAFSYRKLMEIWKYMIGADEKK